MGIEHWIIIYLFINGVLCYIGGGDSYEYPFSAGNIAKAFIGAAFALPMTVVVVLAEVLLRASIWLDGVVQFRTYWRYVFVRHRLIFEDHDTMTNLWEWGQVKRNGNSLRDRLWRHAQSLIHKVNKYTPPEP